MNETLIGVVLGGLIGWIAPLLTLRYSERRWKKEALVAILKLERDRMEGLYDRTLQSFLEGATKNSYSSNMTADMLILMPNEVSEIFT